ncbi:MAG: hypothetical protein HKN16_01355 [Saprospiraceae bacterium]|nr:hypothetical protein [Saprospiraceae bacterium]
MKYLKKFFLGLMLLMSTSFFFMPEAKAQCPMCKMAAESNLKDGGTAGRGLNKGILYMLLTPYVVIGAIGYVWWKNRPKEGETYQDQNWN